MGFLKHGLVWYFDIHLCCLLLTDSSYTNVPAQFPSTTTCTKRVESVLANFAQLENDQDLKNNFGVHVVPPHQNHRRSFDTYRSNEGNTDYDTRSLFSFPCTRTKRQRLNDHGSSDKEIRVDRETGVDRETSVDIASLDREISLDRETSIDRASVDRASVDRETSVRETSVNTQTNVDEEKAIASITNKIRKALIKKEKLLAKEKQDLARNKQALSTNCEPSTNGIPYTKGVLATKALTEKTIDSIVRTSQSFRGSIGDRLLQLENIHWNQYELFDQSDALKVVQDSQITAWKCSFIAGCLHNMNPKAIKGKICRSTRSRWVVAVRVINSIVAGMWPKWGPVATMVYEALACKLYGLLFNAANYESDKHYNMRCIRSVPDVSLPNIINGVINNLLETSSPSSSLYSHVFYPSLYIRNALNIKYVCLNLGTNR